MGPQAAPNRGPAGAVHRSLRTPPERAAATLPLDFGGELRQSWRTMTTASHGPADGHGDPDHGSHFDGEPTQELAPGEPRTPGWLPAVGLALFLGGGVAFLTMGDDAAAAPAGAASASAAAPAAAAPARPTPVVAAPLPRPAPPPPQILPSPVPADPGGLPPALAKLSPEQRAELQRRLDAAKKPGTKAPAGH